MKFLPSIKYLFIGFLSIVSCVKDEGQLSDKKDRKDKENDDDIGILVTETSENNITKILSYGDSILFLKENAENIVYPINNLGKGEYTAFPGGLEIDNISGAISLLESETGLRYRVNFVPENSTDTIHVKIVISGVNFLDHIFNLSKGDSIANAIYNAQSSPFIPGQFGTGLQSIFDDGGECKNQGFAVSPLDGHINLAQSLRNGALPFKNGAVTEVEYRYRIDDFSNKTLNKLKVKLYLYNTENDIPAYLWDIILKERAGTLIPAFSSTGLRAKVASPRPPCLIIVMN